MLQELEAEIQRLEAEREALSETAKNVAQEMVAATPDRGNNAALSNRSRVGVSPMLLGTSRSAVAGSSINTAPLTPEQEDEMRDLSFFRRFDKAVLYNDTVQQRDLAWELHEEVVKARNQVAAYEKILTGLRDEVTAINDQATNMIIEQRKK